MDQTWIKIDEKFLKDSGVTKAIQEEIDRDILEQISTFVHTRYGLTAKELATKISNGDIGDLGIKNKTKE